LAQNEDLKRQIVALNVEQGSIQSVVSQNEDLLAMLGRSAAVGSSTASSSKVNGAHILGAVLVRPPMAAYDEIIIDAGSDDGIMAGARVYAPGNVLIGTTTDVLSQTSKVTLFSSPGQQYPVLIGSSHIPATSVGRGGGQYEADVPQASKIDQGDIVSDSSLSDSAFGIVTTVLANPADPFETVLFAPPVNIYQLRWVLVEAPAKKN
jgi:cell shape-determining protein MreC